ncbi:MAG: T9SS type A sorting domain-containing protein, partial [Saprospiraceae bacterium]
EYHSPTIIESTTSNPITTKEQLTLIAQPNPFRSETQLRFQLPDQQQVSLQLFDQMGRLVQTIIPMQTRAAGEYVFNLRNEQGLRGMYFVLLQTERKQLVQKIMVLND